MIRNVFSPHFTNNLQKYTGDRMYSILADKSTDISIAKLLEIATIHHSETSDITVSTFVTLVQLEQCTAENIVMTITQSLTYFNLDLHNMQGIDTDNGS
jgi:hypothetical protein